MQTIKRNVKVSMNWNLKNDCINRNPPEKINLTQSSKRQSDKSPGTMWLVMQEMKKNLW